MTADQLQRELRYRTAMALAREMLKSGTITDEEFRMVDAILIKSFQPVLSYLYP